SSRRTVSTSGSSGIADRPFVQRSTDDGALEAKGLVEVEVSVTRDSAARHQAPTERVSHGRHGLRVDAFHGAVATDVGVDEVLDSTLEHGGCELDGVNRRLLGPTPDGNPPSARIDGDGHLVWSETVDHRLHRVGALHGEGSDHDAVDDL